MILDTEKLVSGPVLLESIFEANSRPTLRWLDNMKARKIIPHYKIGHGVWYDVAEVRAKLQKKNIIRAV